MWLNRTISMYTASAGDDATDQFIELVISELASESDQIVAVSGENAVIIGNKVKIAFSNNRYTAIGITVTCDTQSWSIGSLNVVTGSGAKTYKLNFHIAISNDGKVINIKIKSCYTPDDSINFNTDILYSVTDSNIEVFSFTHANSTGASTTRNFATSRALQRVNDQQAVYTAQNRIPYIHDSDSTIIDTINGKVLTEGGIKADNIETMLDSSYIIGDALYPSDIKQYYAIDDHTLIEV